MKKLVVVGISLIISMITSQALAQTRFVKVGTDDEGHSILLSIPSIQSVPNAKGGGYRFTLVRGYGGNMLSTDYQVNCAAQLAIATRIILADPNSGRVITTDNQPQETPVPVKLDSPVGRAFSRVCNR